MLVDIICVHSDTPNAVEIIKSLKKHLKNKSNEKNTNCKPWGNSL